MPIYVYQCQTCQTKHEVLQKFSDPPLNACPRCGDENVQKLFTPEVGLSFRGSGFYITDYVRDGKAGKKTALTEKGTSSTNAKS